MPKIKTNRGARKRFGKTATGKIKRKRAGLRHILTSKSADRKRRLRRGTTVSKADERNISRLIPYL